MLRWIKNLLVLKNILFLLLILLVLAGISNGNEIYTRMAHSHYKGEAIAQLLNIVPEEERIQELMVSRTNVVGYHLAYSYSVKGKEITAIKYLPANKDLNQVCKKFNQGENLFIRVKYSEKFPSDNFISDLNPGLKK